MEIGTVEHRFHCPATRPVEGWPARPDKANLVVKRLSETRQRILRHHGLLVLRLPAQPVNISGSFEWLRQPDITIAHGEEVCWHFDGSMLNGMWKPYRSTGFGIVVTGADGRLLAYGRGQPPHWCKTAAAAEAWALCSVVSQAPFVPSIRTDCMSLISTAAAGIHKATEPRRMLARIWVLIGVALDGDIQQLGDNSALVWVPAHTSPSAIGEAKRSDGARLTHIDWRANRLADGLAKQAATATQPPDAVLRLLASALVAVRYAATLLGCVTHAANNHILSVIADDGTVSNKVVRDSVDKPRARPKFRIARPALLPPPPRAQPDRQVRAWAPSIAVTSRSASCTTVHRRRMAALEDERLRNRVLEIGASLTSAGTASAAERLAAVRARVVARCLPAEGRGDPS